MMEHRLVEFESQMADFSGPAKEHEPARLGVLIVGHGTRSAAGQQEFLATVEQAAKLLRPLPVEAAYLELVEPDIPTGLARLAAQGIAECVVAPLLLFAAGHAKQDIPASVAEAAARFPEIRFRQASHLGLHEELIALSANCFRRSVRIWPANEAKARKTAGDSSFGARFESQTAGRTMLVLVGRGSLDDEALAEMRQFTGRRLVETPVSDSRTCFLAMAKPSLSETLAEVGRLAWDDVVVQPHLLFAGELLVRARNEVERAANEFPATRWWWADHLGPADAVARALVSRALAAPR